jgi:Fungal Zn(2)-Cys(6) binuclear cluster domain
MTARDMQAIPPSTRIIYPVKSSLPTPPLTAIARSSAVPNAFAAFLVQQSVGFAFPRPPNDITPGDDTETNSQVDGQHGDSCDDSLPVPESRIHTGDSNNQGIYVFKNPFLYLPQPSQTSPDQLSQQERNLIRNLAPGEFLRLGYGTASGPHFLRIPHPSARDRIIKACDGCRLRKTKCTGEKPNCLRCTDRGIDCVYSAPRIRGPTKYQLWLRKQKALLEAKQNPPPPPVIRLSDLPPHLIAFDPRIKAYQEEQQRPASCPSEELDTLDQNILQQQEENPVRRTAFALPSNIVSLTPMPNTASAPSSVQTQNVRQPQQVPPQSHPPLALPSNPARSLPGSSSEVTVSSSHGHQAPYQKLSFPALQLADLPTPNPFDEDGDMLFTPLDSRAAEFDRQSSIHGDDYIWVDQMDDSKSNEGSTTFESVTI